MGSRVEKQEQPWDGSLKGQITKVVDFAGYMVSVKSCSTEAATIDNKQRNGQDPVIIKLDKNMKGIKFDLITMVCQPLV